MNESKIITADEIRELDASFRALCRQITEYDVHHKTDLESLFDKETSKLGAIIGELLRRSLQGFPD
jgi:hypothetical protein